MPYCYGRALEVTENIPTSLLEFFFLGMMSTTASLGLILLWDVDAGLTQIDKYLYSTEDYIKVQYDHMLFACQVIYQT